jgi:LemA protein
VLDSRRTSFVPFVFVFGGFEVLRRWQAHRAGTAGAQFQIPATTRAWIPCAYVAVDLACLWGRGATSIARQPPTRGIACCEPEPLGAAVTVFLVLLALVVVVLGWLVLGYNGLIKKRNRTQEAWSQIDVELKRRHDLIPNLVETVKGYATHERETFEAVTAARTAAVSAGASGDPAQVGAAESTLTRSMRSLFAVAENYPQLRAADNFRDLQEQLTATEDKLEYARRYYNASVRDFDTAIQSVPRNLVASLFGFRPFAYFSADSDDRLVPSASFRSTPETAELPPGEPPTAG